MEITSLLWWTLCVLTISQISWANSSPHDETQVQGGSSSHLVDALQDKKGKDLEAFKKFKESSLYVEPYEPGVLSLSKNQLNFFNDGIDKNIESYKQILESVIKKSGSRGRYMYMTREGAILLNNIRVSAKRWKAVAANETPKFKTEFYIMLAKFAERVVKDSEEQSKQYMKADQSTHKVNVDEFRSRVEAVFKHVSDVIKAAPMGVYVKWNELKLYKDEPETRGQKKRFIDEVIDLTAQVRALGYSRGVSMGEQVAKVLRKLANGEGIMSRNHVLGYNFPWAKDDDDVDDDDDDDDEDDEHHSLGSDKL